MKHRVLLAAVLPMMLLLSGCQPGSGPEAASSSLEDHILPGLAAPVRLSPDSTLLLLEDFFLSASDVDTFFSPPEIQGAFVDDRSAILLTYAQRPPLLSSLRVEARGQGFDLLLIGPRQEKVSFRLPDNGYTTVSMKGDMNAWNATTAPFQKVGGEWQFTFSLPPGRYQYLYMVDGREMKDPANELTISNGIGGMNNLLVVGKGQDDPPAPALYSLSHDGPSVRIGSRGMLTRVLPFWQHRLLDVRKMENGVYEVEIPAAASEMGRSMLRVYGYGPDGLTNDVLIPLEGRGVVSSATQLTRYDKEAQIMYFPLMDRFNNGNPANDQPVDDDRLTEKTNFQGGDIAGITQKIADGYLDSLHVSALWLSPMTQNPAGAWQEWVEPKRYYSGYHGYWPIRSTTIDHRFGTDAELHELVNTAHGHDMNVYLDYVCNHVHQEHPLYQNHPDWATNFILEDSTVNIRIWDEQRLTTWFDHFLPSLDFSRPEVVEAQTDSTMFWITEYGLDGFRHDATKHINTAFWRTLTRKLKEQVVVGENRPIYQIGETYGSRELISRYIGSGLLDAQFDFSLYFEVRDVFARQEPSFELVKNAMEESFGWFGHHSTMGYITGNHDQSRFISLAGGALAFDESAIEAGFSREIGVGDPVGYDRLHMLAGFLFSIPGIPVIFYGDEIGMPGAGDPDNRRMMRFSGLSPKEQETLETFRRLTALRSNHLPLTYGDTEVLLADQDQLAFARTWFGELAIAVFNKSGQPATVTVNLPDRYAQSTLQTNFKGQFSKSGTQLTVELPPNSFELLTTEKVR